MTEKLTKLSWLEELYALSHTAASATDLEEALNVMLRHIADGFSAGSGTIALVQQGEQPTLEIAAGTDLPREAIGKQIQFGQGVLGQVAHDGKPMLINGTLDASRTSRPQGPTARRIPSSSMCWPLTLKGQIMGVLAVNRFEPMPAFEDKDLHRGGIMVNMLALVIENLRMHREQQKRIAELVSLNRQLAEAQAQLLQQEKMASIGQLAAGVAHEINNPLGFVSSNLRSLTGYLNDLIARLNKDPAAVAADQDLQFVIEDAPSLIQETSHGLERVRKIVQDLRDFSRIDSAEEWEWADINNSLTQSVRVGLIEFQDRVRVDTQFGEVPPVRCLSSQLNQVFLSVLLNAAQAVSGQGVVTIQTGHDEKTKQAWVRITDTGCGIAPEHIERIFDPFFTTKPVGTGTGLGLSLAYSIMKKHHGQIEVSSTVGQGSTFTITLPTQQP